MNVDVPQLNINGTAKSALIEDHVGAAEALRAAIQALRKIEPHGRDWQGVLLSATNTGHRQALYRYQARTLILTRVLDEVEALTLAIDAQPDPRQINGIAP